MSDSRNRERVLLDPFSNCKRGKIQCYFRLTSGARDNPSRDDEEEFFATLQAVRSIMNEGKKMGSLTSTLAATSTSS